MIESGRLLQQRYRIDKQIGQGGMGAVYVATDERFGSTVAIKETLCMDDNFRKAIEREARLLNSLKHSALPRVSDHFIEDEGQFLVMEYVPGEDLGFILERDRKPFVVDLVMTWADQLLDALDFLHTQLVPVIHRDIKPQNLKIAQRGQIILLDFGLAKGNPTDASHQTAAKSIFGYSKNYASLEQIQGTGTDPRSDLYSLAATLYHLLTGVAPEDALTRAMSVLSQRPDPLQAANMLRPAITRGVAGVLQMALDLNADGRPRSAAEMRQMFGESEKYAHFADPITVSVPRANMPVVAEATKMMPVETDATKAENVRQTDVKTEVLPAFASQITSVRAENAETKGTARDLTNVAENRNSRRGFALAAGGLLLLMVGGLVAGGLYVTKPGLFGASPQSQKSPDQTTMPTTANASNSDSSDQNTNTVQEGSIIMANTNAAAPLSGEKSKTTGTPGKLADTAKTANSLQTGPPQNPHEVDPRIPPSAAPGDAVITRPGVNGPVTRTFPNGTRQGNQFPPGFDPRTMTPEQKRRLRIQMRQGQKQPPNFPNQ